MTDESTSAASSHRQILRASSIIAAASLFTIAFGLARVKLAAVLLGASGVGMIGLLQNVLQVATVIGSLTLNVVGARHIAAASAGGPGDVADARRTLAIVIAGLAMVTGLIFWSVRDIVARIVFDDVGLGNMVGWLTIGVILTIGIGYQTAVLTGLRRMGDLARSSILSAFCVTLMASASILLLEERGILLFILATPICTFLVGHLFVRRQRSIRTGPSPRRRDVTNLLRLGLGLTVAGAFSIIGQLIVRILIERQLGLSAVGYFQAAWFISMTYLGFVLQAMSADFLPRLTAVRTDKVAACRVVNEQTEIALLLAAPVLVTMLALAPMVMTILYSGEFIVATTVLQWQVLGDLLRIAAWPLGIVLIAFADGRRFMVAEVTTVTILSAATALLLPGFGIEAGGISVLLMNLWYLPLVFILVQRHLAFRWTRANVRLFGINGAVCVLVFLLCRTEPVAGAVLGCTFAVLLAIVALLRLEHVLPRRLARIVGSTRRLFLTERR